MIADNEARGGKMFNRHMGKANWFNCCTCIDYVMRWI